MTGAAPVPPLAATGIFGSQLTTAQRYADVLVGTGVAHGHLGPREVPRVWERHLLNSALLCDLLPDGAAFVDVGTGAGLPGVAMAIRRPDLEVTLVEPMQRRVDFLHSAVSELALGNVRVVRGRAEDAAVVKLTSGAQWVVARAVAPIDRLVRWCVPLLRVGGQLLAMKGETAATELAQHRVAITRSGGSQMIVRQLEWPELPPTWVIAVTRSR